MINGIKLKIWSLLFLFLFIGGASFIFAQDQNARDSSKGVTVSPPIIEYSLDPGESVNGKIKLTNPLDHPTTLYPLVYDFIARGERGEQKFIEPGLQDSSFSLARWISYSRPLIGLEINQVDYLNFTIDVPLNAEPGGHYGVIFFSTSDPEVEQQERGKVSITGMVGCLILTKVSGDIRENAKVISFSAPYFSLKGPTKFVTRVENLGNVHFKPKGSINIFDYKGENVDAVTFNETAGNILPESIRRFEKEIWDNEGRWGRFTAKLNISYGDTHKTLESELVFWIIPVYVLIILGLVLLLIVVGVWMLLVRRKRRALKLKTGKTPRSMGIDFSRKR